MRHSTKKHAAPQLPPASDWRTSDHDEIFKRRVRTREETFHIQNLDPAEPIFSNLELHSASGMSYRTEIRDITTAQYSRSYTDFRINGLGTCKHTEALLLQIARRQPTSLLKRLEQILAPTDPQKTAPPAPVTDPAAHFANRARETPWLGASQPALQILDDSTWDALKNLAAAEALTAADLPEAEAEPLLAAAPESEALAIASGET